MLELSALDTSKITSAVFNFTDTQSPGPGFDDMGNGTKVLTFFLGNLFYVGVITLAMYALYVLVFLCRKSSKICNKLDLWLIPKLIFSAAICY